MLIKDTQCNTIRITNKIKYKFISLESSLICSFKLDMKGKLTTNNIDYVIIMIGPIIGFSISLVPIIDSKPMILDDYLLDTLISTIKEEYNKHVFDNKDLDLDGEEKVYFGLDLAESNSPTEYNFYEVEMKFNKYNLQPIVIEGIIMPGHYLILEPITLKDLYGN